MICRIYDIPGGTLEHYEAVTERTVPTSRTESTLTRWKDRHRVHGHRGLGFRGRRNRDMEQGLGDAIQEVMAEADLPEPGMTQFEVHNLDWLG